jgi:hypothetical protein
MDNKIVEFPAREPLAEAAEVEEMRASLLAVRDDRAAMQQVVMLAERAADIVNEIGKKITEADRQSLLWHLSLIHTLAAERKGWITPLCSLPRFNPPDGAALPRRASSV